MHARVVSSRAAEHLFWLGRYAERSEHGARLLRAALSRVPDAGDFSTSFWRAVRVTASGQGLVREDAAPASGARVPTLLSVAEVMLYDADAASGLAVSVAHTVRVARAVRDRLSSDNWRLLQGLGESMVRPDGEGLAETLDLLDRTVVGAGGGGRPGDGAHDAR